MPVLNYYEQLKIAVAGCHQIPGEDGRVFVPSRSRTTPWLVDVDEYNGVGQCRCEDFICNHEPYLSGKRAAEGYSPMRRCLHINAAIEYLHLIGVRRRNGD